MKKLCKNAIISIDSGLKPGIALISLDGKEPKPVWVKSVLTTPMTKKMKILQSDDYNRRIGEVWGLFEEAIELCENVLAVCTEAITGGQSEKAVKAMAYGACSVSCFALHLGVPYVVVSAQDVKRAATGRKNASKEEIWDKMDEKYPHLGICKIPKNRREHIADACAIFLASRNSGAITMAINLLKGK